uniref:Uncharacterized protein n=1 Tax=Oryza sativa subsp. indica TaxID=39946 RepID=A0A679AJP6_ORYSI|nr:hypothetical protein [Oryza sativa Indica Group]
MDSEIRIEFSTSLDEEAVAAAAIRPAIQVQQYVVCNLCISAQVENGNIISLGRDGTAAKRRTTRFRGE